jgi:hypothetical protein
MAASTPEKKHGPRMEMAQGVQKSKIPKYPFRKAKQGTAIGR